LNCPKIENALIEIDYSTRVKLPAGGYSYTGVYVKTRENVEIL